MFFYESKGSTLIKVCVICVIVLILGIITFNLFKKEDVSVVDEEIIYEFFPLYSLDEKAGIVNKKGEVIIEPKYLTVYIPNPGVDVFACVSEEKMEFFGSCVMELKWGVEVKDWP